MAPHSGYGPLHTASPPRGQGAAAMLRQYDERPDGKLDIGEFTKLVHDLETSAMARQVLAPLPPI